VAALIVSAGAGGCLASQPPTPTATTRVPLPEQAQAPTERCGFSTPAVKAVVSTGDGVRLAAAEFGSGPRGVVLLPQAGSDLCGWSSFTADLLGAGLHALAIEVAAMRRQVGRPSFVVAGSGGAVRVDPAAARMGARASSRHPGHAASPKSACRKRPAYRPTPSR
jgi:hypothetical protein